MGVSARQPIRTQEIDTPSVCVRYDLEQGASRRTDFRIGANHRSVRYDIIYQLQVVCDLYIYFIEKSIHWSFSLRFHTQHNMGLGEGNEDKQVGLTVFVVLCVDGNWRARWPRVLQCSD